VGPRRYRLGLTLNWEPRDWQSASCSYPRPHTSLAGGADAAAARAHLAGEMFRVVRVLGQIGVNVNQLAKVANATGVVPPEARHALAALARATDRLTQLLEDQEQGVRS
jgi:hypothetical protein